MVARAQGETSEYENCSRRQRTKTKGGKAAKRTASRKAKPTSQKKARADECNNPSEISPVGLIPTELQVTPDAKKAKGLPEEIRPFYEKIARIYKEAQSIGSRARVDVLKKCYELGQEVNKLLTPAAEAGDDTESLERLAGALGVNPRSLRDAGNVAATIPLKEFESFCSHAEICWSHLKILAMADTPTRRKLALQVIRKGSSVRDLSNSIRDNSPNAKQRGPGKSRSVPVSPQTALRQMRKEFQKLEKSYSDIYFGKRFNVAKVVEKLEDKEVSDALCEEAHVALKAAQSLVAKLPDFVKQLNAVVRQMKGVPARRRAKASAKS